MLNGYLTGAASSYSALFIIVKEHKVFNTNLKRNDKGLPESPPNTVSILSRKKSMSSSNASMDGAVVRCENDASRIFSAGVIVSELLFNSKNFIPSISLVIVDDLILIISYRITTI
jgi:hypothetical protein